MIKDAGRGSGGKLQRSLTMAADTTQLRLQAATAYLKVTTTAASLAAAPFRSVRPSHPANLSRTDPPLDPISTNHLCSPSHIIQTTAALILGVVVAGDPQ